MALLLLALAALLALLTQCGDDDEEQATRTPATAAPTRPETPAPVRGASAAAVGESDNDQTGALGTVTAGGTDLLGAAAVGDLRSQAGQEAVGRAVKVQSVPADEGFWVGTSEQDRLWVQLRGTRGESDYKVREGDSVDFSGTVTRAVPGFANKMGVTAAEGSDQLTEQGYYMSVPSSSVALHR